jgi:hypothetical protein
MFLRLTLCSLLVLNAAAQQPPSATPAPAPPTDRVEQMRADLNQMESLMNNMQSEINFLRDQNLQILLNTNVRMWTILIRDLRRQLDDEEQRRIVAPASAPKPK